MRMEEAVSPAICRYSREALWWQVQDRRMVFVWEFPANISSRISTQARSSTREYMRGNGWNLDMVPRRTGRGFIYTMGTPQKMMVWMTAKGHLGHSVAMSLGLSEYIGPFSKFTLAWISRGFPVAYSQRQGAWTAPAVSPFLLHGKAI